MKKSVRRNSRYAFNGLNNFIETKSIDSLPLPTIKTAPTDQMICPGLCFSKNTLEVNYPAHRAGHLKNLNEGDCIPPAPAPHSSPSTGRGILRWIS